MTALSLNNWQAVETEILSRIRSRQWQPGELIPNEAQLAEEFGCARATVNRALRSVAENGLLDRRRKAGTRVNKHPILKATLSIPIIREEVENRNQSYSYVVLSSNLEDAPDHIRAGMKLNKSDRILHHQSVHLADGIPYVACDRWVNVEAVPKILSVDTSLISVNEWLVANEPFTNGDISFSATSADAQIAERLGVTLGEALFTENRTTWNDGLAITSARLIYHPGYQKRTNI